MNSYWLNFMRCWQQHFLMQLATLTVLTATFTVVNFFLALSLNFKDVLTEWGKEVQISAYLKDDLSPKDIETIETKIKAMNLVHHVSLVSKAEAVHNFTQQLATFAPDLLKDGGFESSFPASFQVEIDEQSRHIINDNSLQQIAASIQTLPGIEEVSYGQGWVENYTQFIRGFASVTWAVSGVLILGSLFVIGNAIGTAVSQHRDEIEILELIGATQSMIRRPYLFNGAVLGAMAMSLSLMLNYAFYLIEMKLLSNSWSFMGLASKISFFGLSKCLALLVIGSVLGLIGSYFSVRRLNDGWAASQRVNA